MKLLAVVTPLSIYNNTISNYKYSSNWLLSVESTLDKDISFDGFTPFIYVVREKLGHKDHAKLSPVIKFSDWFKTVASLYGKQFGEDNCRFYTKP